MIKRILATKTKILGRADINLCPGRTDKTTPRYIVVCYFDVSRLSADAMVSSVDTILNLDEVDDDGFDVRTTNNEMVD
jgi:hypothetical protein